MPGMTARRRTAEINTWPGFVDALATLVMVVVFVLMIFTLFQFYLKDLISGREQALARLSQQIGEIADMLALERRTTAELRLTRQPAFGRAAERHDGARPADPGARRREHTRRRIDPAGDAGSAATWKMRSRSFRRDKEKIEAQLRELDALRRNVETLTILRRELEAKLAEQGGEVEKGRAALTEERKLSEDAKARVDLLTRQLNALQQQLAALNATLEVSETKSKEQQVQIADLGRRLNLALASRVEELARFRSEFFGRLRQVLGERSDIRIVGDRFVFQAEVLFAAGSAELEPAGRAQIARVADALREITGKIPPEITWVLQVDGHTDRRPIITAQFPSNWELSTARAISVVKFLMSQGIPSERLSAAGFAEFQPIDARDDEIGWRRNRRIELKLTNR